MAIPGSSAAGSPAPNPSGGLGGKPSTSGASSIPPPMPGGISSDGSGDEGGCPSQGVPTTGCGGTTCRARTGPDASAGAWLLLGGSFCFSSSSCLRDVDSWIAPALPALLGGEEAAKVIAAPPFRYPQGRLPDQRRLQHARPGRDLRRPSLLHCFRIRSRPALHLLAACLGLAPFPPRASPTVVSLAPLPSTSRRLIWSPGWWFPQGGLSRSSGGQWANKPRPWLGGQALPQPEPAELSGVPALHTEPGVPASGSDSGRTRSALACTSTKCTKNRPPPEFRCDTCDTAAHR